uniref:carbonyl reductase (NADPH) n=1 Tax=Wuchereria bancrofti TaxID=6293 RepID=A0A1I8EAR9_WUCBA
MSLPRVFVITGANKGIGYGIVKGLAEKLQTAIIYLTARNEKLGKESLDKLIKELGDNRHSDIRFHQLDITDRTSCENFASYLKKEHSGLDVLVNNAGFAFKLWKVKELNYGRALQNAASEPPEKQARVTIGINYNGTKQVSNILFPLIRGGGRVVNVSSSEGVIAGRYSDEIIARLTSPSLTVADIDKFTCDYMKACIEDKRRENGFPNSAYKVSKAAVIALTFIQAKELKTRNILVNACHPGYVNTDMTSHYGLLTIEEGADTPIYLATLEGNGPTGKFFYKRKEIDWNVPFVSS